MRELICIVCPRGCHLNVDDNNQVTGNFCPRGKVYAISELTNPQRMVTSTIKVIDGEINCVSVITSEPVPKDAIFKVMAEIKKQNIKAPINIGDIIIHNVLNLGVDIVATKTVLKKS